MEWRETSTELERARAERPVTIPGPAAALFGIFTPPAPQAEPAGLCVVMPGRSWRPGRLLVRNARALAAQGFACLRFDCRGIGQSEGEPEHGGRLATAGADVVAAIRYLRRELNQRRFVLCGYCTDARSALAAFPEEGAAIDGLVFMAAPVMEAEGDLWDWRYVAGAATDPVKLAHNLRSPKDWARKALMAARAIGRSAVAGFDQPRRRLADGLEEQFRALARSDAHALFVYGTEDPQYQEFLVAERYLFATLDSDARRRLNVRCWPGRAHVGGDIVLEQALFDLALEWIVERHPQRRRTCRITKVGKSSPDKSIAEAASAAGK